MIEAKPETLIGDRAYDSDPLDEELRRDSIEMIAPPSFKSYQTARTTSSSAQLICKTLDCERLYNVAKLGFEWSSFIERKGHKRHSLLVVLGPRQDTSQFVTGDSESTQDLMRHRRPRGGPSADGGTHGPAHGSPSAASARLVRSDKNGPTTSDRGLCSSRAGRPALEKAGESQRCATNQREDGDRDRR
jgi:hypothetical protein